MQILALLTGALLEKQIIIICPNLVSSHFGENLCSEDQLSASEYILIKQVITYPGNPFCCCVISYTNDSTI